MENKEKDLQGAENSPIEMSELTEKVSDQVSEENKVAEEVEAEKETSQTAEAEKEPATAATEATESAEKLNDAEEKALETEKETSPTTEVQSEPKTVETTETSEPDEQLNDADKQALIDEAESALASGQNEEEEDETDALPDEDYSEKSREELLARFEELLNNHKLNLIKSNIAGIKTAFTTRTKALKQEKLDEFIAKGGTEENYKPEEDTMKERFDALFGLYREKKAELNAQLEVQKEENLTKKQAILETLKDLINSNETLKVTHDRFKELQEEWRSIGMVPKSEINTLWNNHHFLVEKFFDKVRISKELKDLDLKRNLEQKIQLCEKIEELLLENSITNSFKKLQEYHKEWKEIGQVPFDQKDEVWERFKSTTDKINQRRRAHYEELREQLDKNYETKEALCVKIEELVVDLPTTIKGWNEKTKEIDELMLVWKSVGPVSRKVNDEIWARFKVSLDKFYKTKKAYYAQIKEQQTNNYNLKLDLCIQAEAIMNSEDWRNTPRELIRLQQEWKNIGPAPRKVSDKIWKRFRAACDTFFNRKEAFFANINEHEAENLNIRKALIEEINAAQFSEDKTQNLNILKDFQRRWTEIGHVPIKEKDNIHKLFRAAVDKKMETLDISPSELTAMQFRSRVESLKNQPKSLNREIIGIQTKISKIREEINLWENNMGFFASSKNADLLKKEFEKKIARAKNDVKVLKAKLELLQS